ncbi:MBL fold metallo-hydrolase [Pectinatus frisingensis]|uniref:MBL fold metallo-hydrolase n=1 Tax=Pectinatus frisingensis TaxID=865 RepID=UPI0018C56F77|nr:MBL fold metallo-hydrolase [Pectinatus frisingensis]
MVRTAKITYLYNSGFIVELKDCALIFDYYIDKKNCLPSILAKYQKIYFFVSHSHFDHWNPDIGEFSAKVTKYFISYDIHDRKTLPIDKTVVLNEYDNYTDSQIKVISYSSTDAGISFFVETNGWKIFHAGDFNWWHWKADTAQNNAFARNGFAKQMKKLIGLQTDITFFPIDTRLEDCCDWGVKEFCRNTDVKNLIAMHNAGRSPWPLPNNFAGNNRPINIWSPAQPGQNTTITETD